MLNNDTRSAKDFYREIRNFAERAQSWDSGVIWYETKPDERYDLSLVSARVYGRRDEFFAVLAAAGLDGFDQPLTERVIALPGEFRLTQIKRATNFESIAAMRGAVAVVKDAALPEPVTHANLPTTPGDGGGAGINEAMAAHLAAPDPHPQYIAEGGVVDGGTY